MINSKILDAWIKVEQLSEGDIDRKTEAIRILKEIIIKKY